MDRKPGILLGAAAVLVAATSTSCGSAGESPKKPDSTPAQAPATVMPRMSITGTPTGRETSYYHSLGGCVKPGLTEVVSLAPGTLTAENVRAQSAQIEVIPDGTSYDIQTPTTLYLLNIEQNDVESALDLTTTLKTIRDASYYSLIFLKSVSGDTALNGSKVITTGITFWQAVPPNEVHVPGPAILVTENITDLQTLLRNTTEPVAHPLTYQPAETVNDIFGNQYISVRMDSAQQTADAFIRNNFANDPSKQRLIGFPEFALFVTLFHEDIHQYINQLSENDLNRLFLGMVLYLDPGVDTKTCTTNVDERKEFITRWLTMRFVNEMTINEQGQLIYPTDVPSLEESIYASTTGSLEYFVSGFGSLARNAFAGGLINRVVPIPERTWGLSGNSLEIVPVVRGELIRRGKREKMVRALLALKEETDARIAQAPASKVLVIERRRDANAAAIVRRFLGY
ncbi:hypothetical protein JW887_04325 [Candidatus Dojkabacteria bacterium]|nr:hypothetical protein [Candidatus Dojkabacteria bacterium]